MLIVRVKQRTKRKVPDVVGRAIGELFERVATSQAIMDLTHSYPGPAEEAFRAEALRWLPNVSRYATLLTRNPSDADDLTQETFLRACMSWTTFQPGTDCRSWLFTICRHLFLRAHRRDSRMIAVDDPEADVMDTAKLYWEASVNGFGHLFDRIDLGPAIERGLHTMQDEYREAVMLVDIEDYKYADAAAVLGVPIGTVRSRLFRGRRLLQQTLIAHAQDLGLATPATAPTATPQDDERVHT